MFLFGEHVNVSVSRWTWVGEHDKKIWNILWAHGTKYCMMWRNILPHAQGWIIKMDKNINGWKIKIDQQNLFTTKSYVSIQILPIHNQDVCVNRKHHLFISKRYVPIMNWDIMRPHIFYTISTCFLFEFSLLNLLSLGAFLLLEKSNCIISPFPLELFSSIFYITTTYLQFLNIYFIWQIFFHNNGHTKHLGNHDWILWAIPTQPCAVVSIFKNYIRDIWLW